MLEHWAGFSALHTPLLATVSKQILREQFYGMVVWGLLLWTSRGRNQSFLTSFSHCGTFSVREDLDQSEDFTSAIRKTGPIHFRGRQLLLTQITQKLRWWVRESLPLPELVSPPKFMCTFPHNCNNNWADISITGTNNYQSSRLSVSKEGMQAHCIQQKLDRDWSAEFALI